MKRALITGITGQDGSYLAELLLSHASYEVHGVIRNAPAPSTPSGLITFIRTPTRKTPRLRLHYGDLASSEWILDLIYRLAPDEIYNLAAQSHVKVSFEMPDYTGDVTGLEYNEDSQELAIRRSGIKTKVLSSFQFGEMFGGAPAPQDENTPFQPHSPYAAAKVYRLLDGTNVPGGLWDLCRQRHPVQPREPSPW